MAEQESYYAKLKREGGEKWERFRRKALDRSNKWHQKQRAEKNPKFLNYAHTKSKRYKKNHKETIRRQREKYKARKNMLTTALRHKRKAIVFSHYGKFCSCCGEDNILFLTIDHINNDGKRDRNKDNSMSSEFYKRIIDQGFPKDLQIMCYNCNIGRYKNKGGCCPHKIKEVA